MAPGAQLEKTAPAMPGQPQWTDRVAGGWGRARVLWGQMKPGQRRGAWIGGVSACSIETPPGGDRAGVVIDEHRILISDSMRENPSSSKKAMPSVHLLAAKV